MITTLALVVIVLDDLRLRGKLHGVMKQIVTLETEIEQKFARSAASIVASIKAKL